MRINEILFEKREDVSVVDDEQGKPQITIGDVIIRSEKYTPDQVVRRPVFHVLRRILSSDKDDEFVAARDHTKALNLVKLMGMHFHDVDPEDYGLMWDGNKLATNNTPSNIVHDVAHWQMAHKDRKFVPEFGLGDGPETTDTEIANQFVDKSIESMEEEKDSSFLGILWELALGMNSPRFTIEQHQWVGRYLRKDDDYSREYYECDSFDNMDAIFTRLHSHGMIDIKGRPTLFVNLLNLHPRKTNA